MPDALPDGNLTAEGKLDHLLETPSYQKSESLL